ncbi:MAG TPA: DUF262 domain-containing HNH endonuclease family protein [Thermoanaerobaculia bacterium]|nr:DUF262 domain-containing HNH endonuclease family protein [Thermoanaerobaculia bacterium]
MTSAHKLASAGGLYLMGTVGSIQVIGDQTLGRALFTTNLAVPINQRSYKWEKDHVKELFEDFSASIAQGADTEYFLGSIVLTRGDGGRPQVVDGQQRLATTTILVAAIRDHFFASGDKDRAYDIQRDYLLNRDLNSQEWTPKFILSETDNEYFRRRILLKPDDPGRLTAAAPQLDKAPESHARINAAAKIAAAHVSSIVRPYSVNDKTARLLEWIQFLNDGARVIWVIVPDEANAFVMFETLNDRGLELSKADLVKNYIFGKSQDRIKEVQQRWYSMVGAIEMVGGEALVLTYIRHYWSSKYALARDRALFERIKVEVKSKQGAVDLADALAQDASHYAALVTPSHDLWKSYPSGARKSIATLRQLEIEQVRPLLLAIIGKFKKNDVERCLRILVCCSVRFLIVGGGSAGYLEKAYSDLAKKVRAETLQSPKALLDELKKVVPGDTDFGQAFAHATVGKPVLARYYLSALQQKEDNEVQPEYVPNDDQGEITLEHVMPQSQSPKWQIDEDVRRAWYRRIGNMALLKKSQNELADDEGIAIKASVLGASKFSLTAEFKGVKLWGPPEIEERQQRLAKIAVKAWPLKVV